MIEAEGCIIEHSPPETPEMNGPAERSGGVIIQMARVLINENPDLPKTLWPEAVYASAYILKRMPTRLGDRWIIPWMELMKLAAPDGIKDQRINLANLRVYSCLAYSRILDSKRTQSDKMSPRAEIGFLVGYVSKNLYRIWFPHKGGHLPFPHPSPAFLILQHTMESNISIKSPCNNQKNIFKMSK